MNGEAIYGTRPWKVFGEGPTQINEGHFIETSRANFTTQDIRFTTKDNVLNPLILAYPGKSVMITALKPDEYPVDKIKWITILGMNDPLLWSQTDDGLLVSLPDNIPGENAWVQKIETNDMLNA